MILKELPLDVLRSIFDGEHSFLVIELWKCGDSLLNQKLSKGAIKNMKLIARCIVNTPNRWPTLLKFLRIESLSIESIASLGAHETVRKEICCLHKGLRRLEYRSLTINTAIFGAMTGLDCRRSTPLPVLTKRRKSLEMEEDPYVEFHNLGSIFPKLKELSCDVPKNDSNFIGLDA